MGGGSVIAKSLSSSSIKHIPKCMLQFEFLQGLLLLAFYSYMCIDTYMRRYSLTHSSVAGNYFIQGSNRNMEKNRMGRDNDAGIIWAISVSKIGSADSCHTALLSLTYF